MSFLTHTTLVKRLVCLSLLALSAASPTLHSAENLPSDISLETQVYPTGVIYGARYERAISGKQALSIRLGVQDIDHEDEGEQDDEVGDGFGFTLGYKRYLRAGHTGPAIGFKTDLWFNSIDWRDDIGTANERSGQTDVIVLQPTVEISWHHPLGNQFFITPTAAAGFEINVDTDGEDVGEGFIILGGILVGIRF